MSPELEPLWRVEDAAAFLNVSVGTIRNWTSAHKIPFVRFGGTVRYKPQHIREWIREVPAENNVIRHPSMMVR